MTAGCDLHAPSFDMNCRECYRAFIVRVVNEHGKVLPKPFAFVDQKYDQNWEPFPGTLPMPVPKVKGTIKWSFSDPPEDWSNLGDAFAAGGKRPPPQKTSLLDPVGEVAEEYERRFGGGVEFEL